MKILRVQRREFSLAFGCRLFRLLLSHQSAGLFLRVEKAQAHSLALSSNGLKILWLGIHI